MFEKAEEQDSGRFVRVVRRGVLFRLAIPSYVSELKCTVLT